MYGYSPKQETDMYIYIYILVPKTIEIIWICAAHNFFIIL